MPAELLEPFEHGRSIIRGDARAGAARAAARRRAGGRPQPGLDDKAIASWNGLAIAALAEAGRVLRPADWIEAAERAAEFVLDPLSDGDGRLLRSWRDGRTSGAGYLDDYANVAHGLIELHLATGRAALAARGAAARASRRRAVRRRRARRLLPRARRTARSCRADEGPRRQPAAVRELDARARAAPAGAALGRRRARAARRLGLRLVAPALARAPGAFAWALCALDLYLAPPRELAVVGAVDSPVAQAALGRFEPRTVAAVGPSDDVPLLAGKSLVAGPRPYTSASASPARRRSRIPATSRLRRCASA